VGRNRLRDGADVAVSAGTGCLAATTTTALPYSLLDGAAKLSSARGTLSASTRVLDMVAGVVDPALGAATPSGSTTYGGNFEAALVRIAR
jgi:hypothetical protein